MHDYVAVQKVSKHFLTKKCIFAVENQIYMSRKIAIKEYVQGQTILFPESIDSYIASDAPVRLINAVVDQLDLTEVMESYAGGGCSCYSPRMLLKVLFYGYLNNFYSCRKIARAMEENIHFMWLSGKQFPKYNTINNFRSLHLKDTINSLFTQVVVLLVDMGYLTLKEQYIDGTKLEARSNKYTFVWRRSVEKHKAKLESKIRGILQEIETGIAYDNMPDDEPPTPIDSDILRNRIAQINRENKNKRQQKQIKDIENKLLPKLEEYEQKLTTCGNRNSYSKTDHDATFMKLKEDAMNNKETKPAYNLQIATENQFITNFDFYPKPNDTVTIIPFLQLHHAPYKQMPQKVIADAGYGSEENFDFMSIHKITAYVKYNYYHKEQQSDFKNNPFLAANLYYNAKEDYFLCPSGKPMIWMGTHMSNTDNGYSSRIDTYQAEKCQGCHLREKCCKSDTNRCVEINHALRSYKKKVSQLLHSQEGKQFYKQRSVEPEPVFGQMKTNMHYKRIRHFGKEKITMDFAIFAIAFNIGKMWNTNKKTNKNNANNGKKPFYVIHEVIFITKTSSILLQERSICESTKKKIAA
jgi:transposase